MKIRNCLAVILTTVAAASALAQSPVAWAMSGKNFPAPAVPGIYGVPQLLRGAGAPATHFNGRDDGYVVPLNPVAGWRAFTIEARICPDPTGPAEQRFLHIEDETGNRITLETRLAKDGTWSFDTYLKGPESHLTLLDRTLKHTSGAWHAVTLRYDGVTMFSTVDGKPELSGAVTFPAMGPGRTAVGVRLNRVSWYAGSIESFKFTPGN